MLLKRLSPGQRLLAIFVLTIFVPGLLLAVFGARALWQERRFAEQQLQGRLDHGAEVIARALGDQLAQLDALVHRRVPPETGFQDFAHDGSWAFAEGQGPKLRVYPPNILPYDVHVESPIGMPDPALAPTAALDARETDLTGVIAAYRALLTRAKPSLIPEIRHRLARALRKAGHTGEAVRLWRELQATGGRIGVLPADLVAGFELAEVDHGAAAKFYTELTSGRWRLEKVRYLYYLTEIRNRLGEPNGSADDGRLRLAEVVEAVSTSSVRLSESERGAYLAFRHETPFAALVVSPEFLAARIWPRVLAATDTEIELQGISINGVDLYRSSASRVSNGSRGRANLDATNLPWRIEVAQKDVAAFQSAMNRTTNLYLTILAGVIVLLASGGYFVLRTIRRELEVARMKSEFAATVSHEFRSPLTGIRQLGEMLARGRVSEEPKRQQYYDLIVRESDRLTRLVENVLDFSRMEDGRKEYRLESLDTSAWLSAVAEEFQVEASRTGHQLETSIPEHLPAVRGDREALSTAVRNLLDNACKYSPLSKTVWLDAEALNGGVLVQVRDRGVGIPARERSQIFEKFYRGGGELAKQVKGAGLGLSLVQHIMEAHHVEVRVESREGEGSTFSIHLAGAS